MTTQTIHTKPLIHLVGGEKGGVGKTFVSRVLCQYFRAKGQDFTLIEADSQINDVGRIYQDEATATHTLTLSDDPKRSTEPDIIFDATHENPTIVNLPSNTRAVLDRWISLTNLLELARERFGEPNLIQWFVSDGCYESIRQLKESIAAHDSAIPHIVVLNTGRLNNFDFSDLEKEPEYQAIKKYPNFITAVELPALANHIQFFIDKHELTLESAAKRLVDEKTTGFLDEQRLITFLEKCTEAFDGALETLGHCWKLPDAERQESSAAHSQSGIKSEAEIERKEFV